MTMHLEKETVLALRDECLQVNKHAMALFDSLENGALTPEGAKAASLMAGHAAEVRQCLHLLATAEMLGMKHR